MQAWVEACIARARNGQSNCSRHALNIDGMSGQMTRHLYNNVCAFPGGVNYLEVGCWKGSSTVSALCQNSAKATVIDNWSEFSGPREEFLRNVQGLDFQMIEADAFSVTTDRLAHKPYNVYLYDGHHGVDSHAKAITHFWDALADECVILVDDWNWPEVKQGTREGFKNAPPHTVVEYTIDGPTGAEGFWNGCGIFIVKKQ